MRAWILAALLAALILASVPPPAEAGPEPPSPLATAYNTQRKLARATDGTLYAAVTKNVSGTPTVRVLATTDGTAWTTLPPPSTTGLASDRSSLAIDSQGRLHLVWTELAIDGGQVFHSRYDGAWSVPTQLSHSPGYAGFPSLAVDAQDRAHVDWYGFDGAFYQIYYRRLDASGWTNETALTNEAVDATNPALALGPDGRVHIAWFRQNRQGTLNEVAYLRLSGATTEEIRTVSRPGIDAIDPSLVVDGAGTVHVAYAVLEGGESRIEVVERPPGGTWSAPVFASPAGLGALHPSLAIDRGGSLRLAWEGTDGEIYAQARGGSWSPPARLSSGGANRYPNARWAQNFNPQCPADVGVDVVWTHEEGGTRDLAWTSLASSAPCGDSGPSLDAILAVAGVGLLAVVVGTTALLARRRSRTPPPE